MEISYGEETYPDRRVLRAVIWEIDGGRCVHPVQWHGEDEPHPCGSPSTELSHIVPRGMGHQGDRDTVNNTFGGCNVHARSTDNLGHIEWQHVPEPRDRKALTEWIREHRRNKGWAL